MSSQARIFIKQMMETGVQGCFNSSDLRANGQIAVAKSKKQAECTLITNFTGVCNSSETSGLLCRAFSVPTVFQSSLVSTCPSHFDLSAIAEITSRGKKTLSLFSESMSTLFFVRLKRAAAARKLDNTSRELL